MLAEERDQLGMDGHRPGFAARAVLEFTALAGGPGAGRPERLRIGVKVARRGNRSGRERA
jgi:hypothetical protein